jgi:methylmalonyl-CoA mutase
LYPKIELIEFYFNYLGKEMRNLQELRNQSFPSNTIHEWKEKAEQSLKGRTVESLKSNTYENIILKPLYSMADEHPVSQYPAGTDYRRGVNPLGYVKNDWRVAQRIPYSHAEDLRDKLTEAVSKGQTALSFEISEPFLEDDSFNLLSDLAKQFPYALNTKTYQKRILSKLEDQENLTGFIANDPISLFLEHGVILEDYVNESLKSIRLTHETSPSLRTMLIDTTPYHNGGASAVQELSIAVSEGVYYLQRLIENGMEVGTALSKMVFQFSIGSNFFMELSKIRAARIIWSKVTQLYGADPSLQGMHISAETSVFTKTIFDPHVNILRAGNEAFAAVLGGIQYLHVMPYDNLTGSSSFSERIARNIQLVLKEESHLKRVADPAGGSWYIEELTTQLAERAWVLFQQIEAKGGIIEVLKSNWLQDEINEVYTKRNKDIQTRKQSIVGTNVYANLDETVPTVLSIEQEMHLDQGIKIESLQLRRLSEPFEKLREKAKKLDGNAAAGMICLGELKQYKARLDFMKAFLAPGGIKVMESPSVFTMENAKEFVKDVNKQHLCICGTNEQYETLGHDILTELKAQFPNKTFYLAGLPEPDQQEKWIQEGISQFIHLKSNCYETLSAILSEMEVTTGEKA